MPDCCFDYMKDEGIGGHSSNADGYPWGSWGDENYCDTLFIVHGSRGLSTPSNVCALQYPTAERTKMELVPTNNNQLTEWEFELLARLEQNCLLNYPTCPCN